MLTIQLIHGPKLNVKRLKYAYDQAKHRIHGFTVDEEEPGPIDLSSDFEGPTGVDHPLKDVVNTR